MCDKRFFQRQHLARHSLTHMGMRLLINTHKYHIFVPEFVLNYCINVLIVRSNLGSCCLGRFKMMGNRIGNLLSLLLNLLRDNNYLHTLRIRKLCSITISNIWIYNFHLKPIKYISILSIQFIYPVSYVAKQVLTCLKWPGQGPITSHSCDSQWPIKWQLTSTQLTRSGTKYLGLTLQTCYQARDQLPWPYPTNVTMPGTNYLALTLRTCYQARDQ